MRFEWNPDKARRNFLKHGISFREAITTFRDPLSVTYPDPDHSFRERRYVIIGLSSEGRILIVSHTERVSRIRIISARKATRNEQRFYEEGS